MATTAAYSADVLISSGGVDANQHQWEYSVPIRHDVRVNYPCLFFFLFFSGSRSLADSYHRASTALPSRVLPMIPAAESPGIAIPKSREVPPCQDSCMTRVT